MIFQGLIKGMKENNLKQKYFINKNPGLSSRLKRFFRYLILASILSRSGNLLQNIDFRVLASYLKKLSLNPGGFQICRFWH